MKNIMLIGGEGYIGTVVGDYLLKKNYNVISYDNLIYFPENKNYKKEKSNFKFIKADIRDHEALLQNLKNIEVIVILAGLVGDPIVKKYPLIAKKINNDHMYNLIKLISDKFGGKTVFISTCSNYGLIDDKNKADENTILNPLSNYAKAKVDIENFILSLNKNKNFNATILRFATAFGLSQRMRFDLTINEFTKKIYENNHLSIFDELTWRPYCHVKDFARLILKIIDAETLSIRNQIFNAGGDNNNFTKKSIIEMITKLLPTQNISYVKGGTDPRNYRVNFSKVKNTLNFTPKYNVEYGIEEIINFLKNNKMNNINPNTLGNFEINQYEKF